MVRGRASSSFVGVGDGTVGKWEGVGMGGWEAGWMVGTINPWQRRVQSSSPILTPQRPVLPGVGDAVLPLRQWAGEGLYQLSGAQATRTSSPMVPGGNTGYGLSLGRRPRHCPGLQVCGDLTMASGGLTGHPYHPVLHHCPVFSSASLHRVQITPLFSTSPRPFQNE